MDLDRRRICVSFVRPDVNSNSNETSPLSPNLILVYTIGMGQILINISDNLNDNTYRSPNPNHMQFPV